MGKKLVPTSDGAVHINVFGNMTVSNSHGTVQEGHHKQGLPWLLLKYMLVHRERPVNLDELLGTIWPDNDRAAAENAARVRLRRIRESIAPLGLGGVEGLILFAEGEYSFNPHYDITTDVDLFTDLMAQIHKTAADDPTGLKLCSDALALVKGPFMERVGDEPWLAPFRKYYHQELCKLFQAALTRSKAIGTTDVIAPLCQKSAVLAPNEETFHRELIRYLMDQRMELDLVRHITTLARKGSGNAAWLSDFQ